MPESADHEDGKLAVNCCVPPTVMDAVEGDTVTAEIVIVAVPEDAPSVEVTVQTSGEELAVTTPFAAIVAMHPGFKDHVEPETEELNCCVPETGITAFEGETVIAVVPVGISGLSGPSAALMSA